MPDKTKKGMVYLVGAGPGDPGLITVKGMRCIETADVLIYDYLASPALLSFASPEVEIIYVGKKEGTHTLPQEEINRLIVKKALEGNIVTRLKGGDPFIFGRGGEEAEELVAAGVPFEVVPGISAGFAAAAYAGIPLTHRDCSSSFAVATGHLKKGLDISHLTVPQSDTLVYLMSVGNLPKLAEKIIGAGWPEETPAALIQQGTRGAQRTVEGTLGTIAERAREEGIEAP